MATLLDHDDPRDIAACNRVRQIVRKHECDEAESAAARALRDQMDAREPAPSADVLIWILAGLLTLVVILAAGMLARL